MKVLVVARDSRVRRALSGLLELVDPCTVSVTGMATLGPELDAEPVPEVVVLQLDRGHETDDVQGIERLARRGCSVIAVCSPATRHPVVLAAGARTCLEEDDPGFADRLAEALRMVSGESATG